MLVFLICLFVILSVVHASPVPQDLSELTIDPEPSPFEKTHETVSYVPIDRTGDSASLQDPYCNSGASVPNEKIDSTQETRIFRRQKNACPVLPKAIYPNNEPSAGESTAPLVNPLRGNKSGAQDDPCKNQNSLYRIHVTCGGREVRVLGVTVRLIDYVLDCVSGPAKTIRPQIPWPRATHVSQYCCNTFPNMWGLYEANLCYPVDPTIALRQWTHQNYLTYQQQLAELYFGTNNFPFRDLP